MKNCWFFCVVLLSPSSWAEWVEINASYSAAVKAFVSVLVGGVG